jgi:hypothetical protein
MAAIAQKQLSKSMATGGSPAPLTAVESRPFESIRPIPRLA